MRPVVIAGGGLAGLATLSELRRRGVDAVVLDEAESIGSTWAQRHDSLRLNSVRWLSHMPGLRMPAPWGSWPTRDNMVTYTRAYAGPHRDAIRQGVRVDRVSGADDGRGWVVETGAGTWEADDVVMATGLYREPVLPPWPSRDAFGGRLIHADAYRNPAEHEGERVLVVGPGVSGVDISSDLLHRRTGELSLAARTPPNLLPREFRGIPLQPLSVTNRYSPVAFQNLGGRVIQRLAWGDLAATPLGRSPEGMFSRLERTGVNPAVDDGTFLPAVRSGAITVEPEVVDLWGGGAVLSDGRRITVDTVIAATGYGTGLEHVLDVTGTLDERHRPPQYGKDNAALADQGLHFVGFASPLTGHLREMGILASRTARRIARGVGGSAVRPPLADRIRPGR
jgi:putative flavoprotein involved in K+ transport